MGRDPVVEQPYGPGDGPATPWSTARDLLRDGDRYWLSTVHSDGGPHTAPVLAVWVGDALHFAAGAGTRKARNLTAGPRCVLTVGAGGLDLVVRGTAVVVRDDERLALVAAAYAAKYGWPVEVREHALWADGGAPTAGPPPWDVRELVADTVLGLDTEGTLPSTRWRF